MPGRISCWYPPLKGAWRQDPNLGGGGALIDMATHLYALLEYFADCIRRGTPPALNGSDNALRILHWTARACASQPRP